MSLKANLTSADLDDIRQSALGAADPLGIAADLAAAAGSGGLADPQDAGLALTLAAEIAESRSKLDAALRYADAAVGSFGDRDDSPAAAARALRARILFRAGRGDEANPLVEPLRPLLTRYPDAPAYVTAALVVGGRAREAETWLTEAVQEVLAERGADPADADDAGVLFFLLQQRHRLRHALGLQHDTHDNLAERLETRLANAGAPDPTAAADLVFWSRDEFGKLVTETEAYGATWDEHRARLERELVRRAGSGRADTALLPGSVAGLTAQAGPGGDPVSAENRAAYARTLSTGAARLPWPPERNGSCWCGSGLKYKKCCLPRARA
ncbi:SEC-C domain-containing protein [Actinoplanes utahensis]|uniref:SEC-C domain-containing protein n=1 Tax=Actinoplanes utahensis TaxID=1869 RepID=A0A0A6ULD1_ACTUT|nr:SEC-C domain-containing protein [Actinoplanes utahensis]KHD75858.1 SEC-C domain-containing protein [Actinoplanes utahensis]GIF32272.1 preprotein translocase SecA [Actinoplanes utahensis]